LAKEEAYTNNIGYSERADVPIEPRLSEQWFLKYPSVEQARNCVEQNENVPGGKSLEAHLPKEKLDTQPAPSTSKDYLTVSDEKGKMRFYPQRWAKVYDHWMEGIKDWCISRQLWWGHRIPVWSKRVQLTEENWTEQLLPWGWDDYVENKWNLVTVMRVFRVSDGSVFDVKADPLMPVVSETEGEYDIFICTQDEELQKSLEHHGFTQDPDVLDTWFSSWLWPFATMGWPEKTETLQKFYPTTDLVTGPDIIFFWVARMIMAGYEFMGEMPFRNVYFTGIIRDKQGRKMSKSLGNSPDPLDLIAQYGADALRFGVIRSAPLGQDVLYDEQQVELGRNFCNKLWNACRFRQMQPGESEGEIRPELLTSDDKWILLKLDQAIGELTGALAQYKFNEAAQTLYRFFWSEYCDWYVEASKAVLTGRSRGGETLTEKAGNDGGLLTSSPTRNDGGLVAPSQADKGLLTSSPTREEARGGNTLAVMDFVLSNTLRLLHPFLPFITEELWHGLGFQQDLPSDQGGDTIMFAHWPKTLDGDFRAHYGLEEKFLKEVDDRNELITQGRNLRRDANLSGNKNVKYVFKGAGKPEAHDLAAMKLLLNAESLDAREEYTAEKGTPSARSALGELYLPLAGVVDVEAGQERARKEIEKVKLEIGKVRQKLANPAFVQKAPPAVLEEHHKRLADWEAKLKHLEDGVRE
jgi:valyl-tRNA synthetase